MSDLTEADLSVIAAMGDLIQGAVGFAAHGIDRHRADRIAERALNLMRSLPVEQRMEAMGMAPMWHCKKHGLSNMDWCSCDDPLVVKVWMGGEA